MMAALAAWGRYRLRPLHDARFAWRAALCLLLIHALVELLDADSRDWVYQVLGLSRQRLFAGDVWQLVSHGLLHGAWWHAILNALAMWWIGARLEHWTGPKACCRVTLAGICAGGVSHVLLGGDSRQILVGISGGLFAVLACASTLSPDSRVRGLPLSMGMLTLLLVMGEGVLTLANPALGIPVLAQLGAALNERVPISHACHFGGGIVGWLCGLHLLRPRVDLETLRRERERREGGN